MSVVDEQPMETLHLYVIPEDQVPQKPDYPSIMKAIFAVLCILVLMGISGFSVAPTSQEVSFTLSVSGFHLAPVSKTLKTTVIGTGKGHTAATYATGIITFYNGAIYTQIIPVDTKLTGSDGVSVLTDQEAVIPPAAQTHPPTYGHISIPAHALVAGVRGNIPAGDMNLACCATSIIAQNPYNFSGGRNARDFTYLTQQDISQTISPLLPTLRSQTLSLLPPPRLNSSCSTTATSLPSVWREAKIATVTIIETCKADSYSKQSLTHAITTYSKHYGRGTLTRVQFFVVSVTEKKGVILTLYMVGQWKPFMMRQYWTGK